MKSRIRWRDTSISKYSGGKDKKNSHFFGRAKKWDLFANLYLLEDRWCWTVRSQSRGVDLIASNSTYSGLKDLDKAKDHVCLWVLVQFLRQIDNNMFRSKRGDNSLY